MSDSYEYHGIRLDIYLKDEKGTVFNVEIQAERKDDLLGSQPAYLLRAHDLPKHKVRFQ